MLVQHFSDSVHKLVLDHVRAVSAEVLEERGELGVGKHGVCDLNKAKLITIVEDACEPSRGAKQHCPRRLILRFPLAPCAAESFPPARRFAAGAAFGLTPQGQEPQGSAPRSCRRHRGKQASKSLASISSSPLAHSCCMRAISWSKTPLS
jgi:hypothetical protein